MASVTGSLCRAKKHLATKFREIGINVGHDESEDMDTSVGGYMVA